jgi:methionyl-tRNA formyltransferase
LSKIIFAGTPDFAASHLQALVDSGVDVVAVYTQPDRPAGRGRKLQASPVKQIALENEIPVYQPISLRDEAAQAELAALNADLMIVVAYGLILPQVVLDTPRLGCVNVHASILPRWRGAAPIHRALLAGDKETGVTLMQMEAGLDTGPMLAKVFTAIDQNESSGELHDRLAALGSNMLVEQLPALLAGKLTPEIQDDALANYANKLEKTEGKIDWNQPAEEIARQVRGLSPWPVAYTSLDDKNVRIWKAEAQADSGQAGVLIKADKQGVLIGCGEGSLLIKTIQMPGGRATEAAALLNSNNHPFVEGLRFD